MIGVHDNIKVNVQSRTDILFQSYMWQSLKDDITLTADVTSADMTFNCSTGHGFVAGNVVTFGMFDVFEQNIVKSVNGDIITLAVPFASGFLAAYTKIIRGNKNINLNGSVTPVEAVFLFPDQANAKMPVDINYIVINMIHSTAADDSLFGNLAAGANYVYFRETGLLTTTLGYFNKNLDFVDRGAELVYNDKAGGGKFSTRIIIDTETVFQNQKRLDPNVNSILRFINGKNLSTLESLTISLIGHYPGNE